MQDADILIACATRDETNLVALRLLAKIAPMPFSEPTPCPCGRLNLRGARLTLADCCGRYLPDAVATPAPDPESLMRSRYTAYTRGDVPYLRATWHASTRPDDIAAEAGTRWLGLEVRSARLRDERHGEVEFVARYRPPGPGSAVRLHERSRFVREEDGRWYYVDGDML